MGLRGEGRRNPICKPFSVSNQLYVSAETIGTEEEIKSIYHVDMHDSEQVVPIEQNSSSVPMHSDPQCIQALVLPCRKRKAAVLNYTEFMDVTTKLSQASGRKKTTFSTLCCGMMLQLLDIANGQDASHVWQSECLFYFKIILF